MAAELKSTSTDEELVQAARDGSASALDQLYRRHATAAWRTAHSVTNNVDDASDAVSEAFLRVLGSLPAGRFPQHVPFRPYLLRAVRNAAIDLLRRRNPSLDDDAASTLAGDRDELPETLNERRTNTDLALDAFRHLPERQRTALWLTEVEGLSPRDAAQVLGVSANNAAQLASRGRSTLRSGFVQAHLRGSVPDACRATVDRLAPLAMGTLSPAKAQAVRRHLDKCDDCRDRFAELADVRSTLSKAAPALPLALAGYVFAAWQTAISERLESLAKLAGVGATALAGAGTATYKGLRGLRHLGPSGVAGGVAGVGATAVAALAVGMLVLPGANPFAGGNPRRPAGAAPQHVTTATDPGRSGPAGGTTGAAPSPSTTATTLPPTSAVSSTSTPATTVAPSTSAAASASPTTVRRSARTATTASAPVRRRPRATVPPTGAATTATRPTTSTTGRAPAPTLPPPVTITIRVTPPNVTAPGMSTTSTLPNGGNNNRQ